MDNDNHGGGAKELFGLLKRKPALLIAGLVGGGLLIYLLIRNSAQGETTQTNAVPASVGSTAQPNYAYQTGYDVGYQRGSYSSTASQATPVPAPTTTGSYSVPSPATSAASQATPVPASTPAIPDHPTVTPTPTPIPTPTTTVPANNAQYANIRARATSGATAGYDKTATGIPIRSSAGTDKGKDDNRIGMLSYGSKIQVTGKAVTGESNLPQGMAGGSNVWYPVKTSSGFTGYVSAYDLKI
jgi:hypothetical protein